MTTLQGRNEAAERLLAFLNGRFVPGHPENHAEWLGEALAAERRATRRAAVEEIVSLWPNGRDEPFKDQESDMAVGYRNGLLAGRVRLMAILQGLLDEEAAR